MSDRLTDFNLERRILGSTASNAFDRSKKVAPVTSLASVFLSIVSLKFARATVVDVFGRNPNCRVVSILFAEIIVELLVDSPLNNLTYLNDLVTSYNSTLCSLLDKHAPLKSRTVITRLRVIGSMRISKPLLDQEDKQRENGDPLNVL